jgi:hypothetical protein
MAHEIGHVLGLSHVGDNTRLMFGGGTGLIVGIPTLAQDEMYRMHDSNLVRYC